MELLITLIILNTKGVHRPALEIETEKRSQEAACVNSLLFPHHLHLLDSNSGYQCMSIHMAFCCVGFANLPASALPHPGKTQAASTKASTGTDAQPTHTGSMKSTDKNVQHQHSCHRPTTLRKSPFAVLFTQ